jgi:release factor glutamine methyltransferase
VLLMRLPGVYAPADDSEFLIDVVLNHGLAPGARVLDIGTGTGRVALGLVRAGAGEVLAIDRSRRAVWAARCNAWSIRQRIVVRRGDLCSGVGGEFDVVVSNPPYVPCATGAPGRHSRARSWDAGRDGRALLDRICRSVPARLAPGGILWLVHSTLSDPGQTLALLQDAGLAAEVAAKARIPFGPVLRSRAAWLREQGLIQPGQTMEELVVVKAARSG